MSGIWQWLKEVGLDQRWSTASDQGWFLPNSGLFHFGRSATYRDGDDFVNDVVAKLTAGGATDIRVVGYRYEGDGEGFYYFNFLPPEHLRKPVANNPVDLADAKKRLDAARRELFQLCSPEEPHSWRMRISAHDDDSDVVFSGALTLIQHCINELAQVRQQVAQLTKERDAALAALKPLDGVWQEWKHYCFSGDATHDTIQKWLEAEYKPSDVAHLFLEASLLFPHEEQP
jgi:hypothetical protein